MIAEYAPGQSPNLYRDQKWTQEGTTFTNYGPGVRRVSLESFGK